MDVLIRYGFTIEEIKNMMDTNPNISNIDDKTIYSLIDKLGLIGCMNNYIKNIFICNPFYLSRDPIEVDSLLNKLKEIGIININILLDSNPYILNLNSDEIEDIYNNLLKEGYTKEEIIDKFNYNSFSIM